MFRRWSLKSYISFHQSIKWAVKRATRATTALQPFIEILHLQPLVEFRELWLWEMLEGAST
jgi:hypothetical protein